MAASYPLKVKWFYRVVVCLALASTFLVVTPSAARADVTYTYTGNPFTNFVGGLACPPDCGVQVTFTLPQALPPNLNCTTSNISPCFILPKSFSITDGSVVITQAGPFQGGAAFAGSFYFLTDASGTITGWAVVADGTSWVLGTLNAPQLGYTTTDTLDSVGTGPTLIADNTSSPGTWTVSGQGVPPVLLDPVPGLLNVNGSVVSVTTDSNSLGSGGQVVQGVAADGVTQVVVRIQANNVGDQFTLTLLDDQNNPSGSALEDGALGSPGDTSFSNNSVVVTAQPTNSGPMAFAVYRAPVDFARLSGGVAGSYKSGTCGSVTNTDDQLACRNVSIQIQDPTGPVTNTAPIVILRPPVILIHGNWSNRYAWQFFQPLVMTFSPQSLTPDPRFNVYPLDYSYDLIYGVAHSASSSLPSLIDFVRQFKGKTNVAAVQADVVGYSMGGLIAREWAKQSLMRPMNLNQGYIHKLITIDTPHLGSELANNLLSSNSVCKFVFARGGYPVGQNVADLAVNSNLLQSLNTSSASLHLQAHVIVGNADDLQTTAADNAYFGLNGFKAYILSVACPGLLPSGGYLTLFTNANNPGNSDLVVSRFSQLASNLNANGAASPIPLSGVPESVVHTVSSVSLPLGPDVLNRMLDSQGNFVVAKPSVSTPNLVITFLNAPVYDASSFQPILP